MLIPDWKKPKAIALVWPEHLGAGRGKLIEFYKKFIPLLSEHVSVEVLFSTVEDSFRPPELWDKNKNINFLKLPKIGDIWLRDYSPFPLEENGSIISVRGKYQPSYHITKADKNYGETDDKVGNELYPKMNLEKPVKLKVSNQHIILDGGNFIHNGLGTAIVTNRIISDNEHVFIEDIRESLRKQLGIKEFYIIPSEPGDNTGHADGLIRFLSPMDLIISEYPYDWEDKKGYISKDDYKAAQEFVDSIADYFLAKSVIVHRMPNGIPMDSPKFESAVGNYTNFLMVGKRIYLPCYGKEKEYDNARKVLINTGIDQKNIIKAPDCTLVAELGGVLNCISTHIY